MNKLLENINEWVQNGPMGNDKQVVPQLLGAGVGILGSILGNKASSSVAPMDPDELKPYFSDARGTLGQMQGFQQEMAGYGRQLMDPGSAVNLSMRNLLSQNAQQQGQNVASNVGRLAAMRGISPGQASMQMNTAANNAMGGVNNAWRNMMQERYGQGLGILGNMTNISKGLDISGTKKVCNPLPTFCKFLITGSVLNCFLFNCSASKGVKGSIFPTSLVIKLFI